MSHAREPYGVTVTLHVTRAVDDDDRPLEYTTRLPHMTREQASAVLVAVADAIDAAVARLGQENASAAAQALARIDAIFAARDARDAPVSMGNVAI